MLRPGDCLSRRAAFLFTAKMTGGNHYAVKYESGLLLRQRGGAIQLLPRPQDAAHRPPL